MNLRKGDLVELSISDLAFGGVGVGKIGDFVVFVPGVVPGDKICGRLTKIKKQYAEAKLEKIVQAARERIAPRCKHFGPAPLFSEKSGAGCGGCSLQFLSYENQLKWKEKMVADALRQIGGFKDARIEPIIGCEDPWFYRNKMEYNFGHVIASETKQSKTILGFHPRKKYDEIFDLEECFLQSPASVKIALAVEKWTQDIEIMAYNPRSNEGILKNLVVREGKNTDELMINLITNGRDFPHTDAFTKFMHKKFPQVTSLYRTGVTIQKGHRTVIEEFHLAGKKTLTEVLRVQNNELRFEILPQAFFQTNTKQAEILYGKILEFAGPQINDKVLDLFCGTGTIGMFFAKSGAKVIGVDNNESAITNARENARLNNISGINFVCADINIMLSPSKHGAPFDKLRMTSSSLLITDPPRAGIAQKSLEKILDLKIPKWIYVSCNPGTLARDLKIICKNGYSIKKVQPVDMFPHTYHIETVCLLAICN